MTTFSFLIKNSSYPKSIPYQKKKVKMKRGSSRRINLRGIPFGKELLETRPAGELFCL